MVPKLFIQSQNIFVGSLQNETNQILKNQEPVRGAFSKQSQKVTVKTLQLELVFYTQHKHDDSIHKVGIWL